MKTMTVLLLPTVLLAARSVQASIFVEAKQLNRFTYFWISGNVNPLALTYRGGPYIGAATGVPAIGPTVPLLGFGGDGNLGLNATVYNLPNLVGPSAFGFGHFTSNPDIHTGTNYIELAFGSFFSMTVDQYSANGATLNDMIAFTEGPRTTYAQLGLTPGIYQWSWSNGGATDSLTLQIHPVPEPTALTLVALGGMAAGLIAVARRKTF